MCLCTGLLDEHTLRRCQKVSQSWQHLAKETMEEIKFRGNFQHQVEAMMKVGHLCVHSGNDSKYKLHHLFHFVALSSRGAEVLIESVLHPPASLKSLCRSRMMGKWMLIL